MAKVGGGGLWECRVREKWKRRKRHRSLTEYLKKEKRNRI
jgi:hypothetical protein